MKPKVSVCMITYNHEKFISQAIESVLMQRANFSYELVIGEDCSEDKTKDIVIKYKRKFPDKINLILNNKNLGMMVNFIQTLKKCNGKYIALLEGDDFWTSPKKLQKQVDFLDKNPDFVICFHNARGLNEETGDSSSLYFKKIAKEVWTIEDLLRNNFIPTMTCVFRNKLFKEFPEWFYNSFPGDWPLHIINAQYGKIGYIDEIMATYRNHGKGAVTGSNPVDNYKRYINTFENFKSYVPSKYNPIVNETISKFYFELSNLYFQKKDIKKAKISIRKCIKKSPFNSVVSKNQLLILVIRLYAPKIYYVINFLKNITKSFHVD